MAKRQATQVVRAELADEDLSSLQGAAGAVGEKVDGVRTAVDGVGEAVEAVQEAVEANHDGGVDSLIAGAFALNGEEQALVDQATPCRGVLLRAPAADEPNDAGPNSAAFFAGPASYVGGIRIAPSQTDGLFLAVNDASKLRLKGTNGDKAKFVIFRI